MKKMVLVLAVALIGCQPKGCETRQEMETRRRLIESVKGLCEYRGTAIILDSRSIHTVHSIYKCQDYFSIIPGEQNDGK